MMQTKPEVTTAQEPVCYRCQLPIAEAEQRRCLDGMVWAVFCLECERAVKGGATEIARHTSKTYQEALEAELERIISGHEPVVLVLDVDRRMVLSYGPCATCGRPDVTFNADCLSCAMEYPRQEDRETERQSKHQQRQRADLARQKKDLLQHMEALQQRLSCIEQALEVQP
jgi:hypothetical protein